MERPVEHRAEQECAKARSKSAWASTRLDSARAEVRPAGGIQSFKDLDAVASQHAHTDYAGILRRVGQRLVVLAESFEAEHPTPEALDRPKGSLYWEITPRDRVLAELAQVLYSSRRRRGKFFQQDLFGEPAWDMLLDLFVHYARNRALRTTSVCVASDVPLSTALRWIAQLERQGLIERGGIEQDKRATLVWLTKDGAQAVRNCLAEFWAQLQSIVD
jgi:DNA-binding MarR family transcriptional regulator